MNIQLVKDFDASRDHYKGNPNAKVAVIEYGDYTCPECVQVRDILLRLSSRFNDNIVFVYRHFVGDDGYARLVAQAAEAAGLQNKFWEMHRRIFDRDAAFDEKHLINYAADLGLDVEKFKHDLHSDKVQKRVEEDYQDALRSGARQTPTLFIGRRMYNDAWDELSITEAIEKPLGVRIRIAAFDFINWAASVGFALIISTLAALLVVNLGLAEGYKHLVETHFTLSFGNSTFSLPMEGWINDGLMAIFFLLVGIEIKREILTGELSTFRKASLPVFAALGGMFFPAFIYGLINWQTPTFNGWGTPMATDIAFTLGLMALLGNRVPSSLRVFVSALAVADDLGAIIIIALFYSHDLNYQYFIYAGIVMALLIGLNRARINSRTPYFILGIFLWYFVYQSGLHATLAGILLAAVIPAQKEANVEAIAAQTSSILRQELSTKNNGHASGESVSKFSINTLTNAIQRLRNPAAQVEYNLQNWSNFLILPLFAFFNTGIMLFNQPYGITKPQNLGVLLGLCLGKPIGIFLFSWFFVKTGVASISNEISWRQILGAGCLAGVGFTMSIFIANAAFEPAMLNGVKLTILISSVLSGCIGMLVLYTVSQQLKKVKPKTQCAEVA